MPRRHRSLAVVFAVGLALTLAPAAAIAPTLASAAPGPRASLPDIEDEVMCPVCGTPLNLAESPQADRERAFIRGRIAAGEDKAQIKRDLVSQYGAGVLALPRSHGFDAAAYVVPIAVLAAGALLLALALPRWRRRPRPAAEAPVAEASAHERRRLDEELARFDG